jgi:hypothetical protein
MWWNSTSESVLIQEELWTCRGSATKDGRYRRGLLEGQYRDKYLAKKVRGYLESLPGQETSADHVESSHLYGGQSSMLWGSIHAGMSNYDNSLAKMQLEQLVLLFVCVYKAWYGYIHVSNSSLQNQLTALNFRFAGLSFWGEWSLSRTITCLNLVDSIQARDTGYCFAFITFNEWFSVESLT